jgi:hypothetical protein
MKRRLALCILMLVATMSSAQTNDKLKELQPFVGTWKCTGMAFASDIGPEHATRGSVTIKWTLGGKWLEVRYSESKTSKNPQPIAIIALWGYDQEKKKLVAASVDNMGGYAGEESGGWEGDRMNFIGSSHIAGMTIPARDVFDRKGKNQISHYAEMQDKAGGWKKTDEETCKR